MLKPTPDRMRALGLAIAAGLLLLTGSFAHIVGDMNSAAFGGLVIDETLARPLWGTALAWNLTGFVGALVLVHCLVGLVAWTMAQVTRAAFPGSAQGLTAWTLVWFLAMAAWVLMANAAWHPLTTLGRPYRDAVQVSLYGVTLFQAATACLLGGAALVIARVVVRRLVRLRVLGRWALAGSAAACLLAFASLGVPARPHSAGDAQKPHVIFIGLDSVRADSVGRAGGDSATPTIDRFLASSTVFTDTVTPVARTFPAWVSIVSGRHPHTTGATMNLLPRELIDEGDTLPRLLRDAGYRSFYATDEVRFSNLDESYGFDDMLAPPIGATDFVLGFFADAPLANLVANTGAGKYLFPFTYANRAAASIYEPETFIERLAGGVTFDQPTFLAVHLTLVHWPYTWATGLEEKPLDSRKVKANASYDSALAKLDEQFGDLLALLERRGALDNAVVVVFSDHGESLGEPASVPGYHAAASDAPPPEIYGHGTSVFASRQYQTVLAMRSHGTALLPLTAGRRISAPASLEDLTPTLAEAFGLEPGRPFDGLSLLPVLRGGQQPLINRIRFTETEFNPPGISTGEIIRQSAMAGAAKYYQVDPETDRVFVRSRYLERILGGRQYAALRGGDLLASVPAANQQTQHLVFAAADGRAAEWLSAPPDAAANPPAFELWTALADRFDSVRERPVTAPPATAP